KQLKVPKAEQKERLNNLLSLAHLEGHDHLYPGQISGGMKQRTAVIRALACSPRVLLMDEPLGAVDHQMRQMLQEELEAIWLRDRTTVLMVTHDIDEAVYLSDRVIVLSTHGGKIADDRLIMLSRPRKRDDRTYGDYVRKLRDVLKGGYDDRVSPPQDERKIIPLCRTGEA
ncbi:MAG: ATP-binding cassette domain-containing protein, partial [Desulfobacteraceae bacterium]|nr:ATP-binding cassette domain-containing protein [Desulfobacteraceae bacterium]